MKPIRLEEDYGDAYKVRVVMILESPSAQKEKRVRNATVCGASLWNSTHTSIGGLTQYFGNQPIEVRTAPRVGIQPLATMTDLICLTAKVRWWPDAYAIRTLASNSNRSERKSILKR